MSPNEDDSDHTGRPTRGRPTLTPDQIGVMRAHIASCALDLFHREGFAGISMRRLASEAGCTPMTLYKYFANKFDILRMLWNDVFSELFDRLDRVAAAETDPRRRLRAAAEGYVEYWLDHREQYFLVFMSSGITQDDVSLFMDDPELIARFEVFRSCLADVRGDATPEDIQVASEVLVCSLNGIAQALVTMSGYPWANHTTLVDGVVTGVAGPTADAGRRLPARRA